ncbi:MAG TPA: hypothetical protein VF678_01340, partial [bacterium]
MFINMEIRMVYIPPEKVTSPAAHFRLERVLIDQGAEQCSYALGDWDGEPRLVYRWNGNDELPIGNPQSRGYATWIVLDPALYDVMVEWLPPNLRDATRTFLAGGLKFEGAGVNQTKDAVILFDSSKRPPLVAKIYVEAMRKSLGKLNLSPEDCRLLLDTQQNKDVVTALTKSKFLRREYKVQDNGSLQIVEITDPDLAMVRDQLSMT